MVTLTERQRKMLDFIVEFYREEEYPPTIREIGEKVGISSTSVVNYNLTRLMEHELLFRHEKVSRGLALNWPKLLEQKLIDVSQAPQSEAIAALGQMRVPLLGHIAAGEPIQVEPSMADDPIDWVDLNESMIGVTEVANQKMLYALRVQGDSMIDASVLDGDIVIMRHQQQAENGQMIAAWIDDEQGNQETTLKYWHQRNGVVELRPANPTYDTRTVPADKVRVMGRVISVFRYL